MNTFGITEKSHQLLFNAFLKYTDVEQVILFGSRAKGNYKKGSDIDLAIKGENCSSNLALNIKAYLNEVLPVPYFVDVIDYDSLNQQSLKEHIDQLGISFYEKPVAETDKKA